jgi:hypothetical protein
VVNITPYTSDGGRRQEARIEMQTYGKGEITRIVTSKQGSIVYAITPLSLLLLLGRGITHLALVLWLLVESKEVHMVIAC